MMNNNNLEKMKSRKYEKQIEFEEVGARIDNKAPRFNPEDYLKSRKTLADSARLRVIDEENLKLVQRLNIVNRLGGKVDCSTPRLKLNNSKLLTVAKLRNRIIARENKKILGEIISTESNYPTQVLLRDWKRIEENMEHTARFPLIWKIDASADCLAAKSQSSSRSRCFFDIEIAETKNRLGRLVFELYDDIVPKTCENFVSFCKGTDEGLSYRGSSFHWILPGYWCQGGDVTKFNGTGGTSIYGYKFKDENFTLRHIGPGVISMWSNGTDTNNSKFNITFKSLPTMDGKRVVFGKLIRGLHNLYKVEELGSRAGKPIKKVIISNCGVYEKNNKHSK